MEQAFIGLILGIIFTIVVLLVRGFNSKVAPRIETYTNQGKLEKDNTDTTALYRLALALFKRAKYSEAIINFERLSELLPEFNDAKLYLAMCYYGNKEYEKARIIFKAGVNHKTKFIGTSEIGKEEFGDMLYLYGHTLYLDKEYDEANKYKEWAYDIGDKRTYNRLNLY